MVSGWDLKQWHVLGNRKVKYELCFAEAFWCSRHSETAFATVSEVLGTGGVAWFAALTASKIG